MRYSPSAILNKQPVVIASAIRGVLYVAILGGVLNWTAELLAAVALGAELVLGLFVERATTPTSDPTLTEGQYVNTEDGAGAVVLGLDHLDHIDHEGAA